MKDPPFFFSVNHIIKPFNTKVIYGVRYYELDYFLLKTIGIEECEQLNNNSRLDSKVLDKICEVITQIEKEYKRAPPLEYINMDVFNVLFNEQYVEIKKAGYKSKY